MVAYRNFAWGWCVVLLTTGAIVFAEEPANKDSAAERDPPLAGHSYHGEAFNEGPRQKANLLPGTGRVHFEITTKVPAAQQFFDQGIGQLHGFWSLEAERTFRQVAMLDPDCAMAYWGMARANSGNETRAKKFLAEAVSRKKSASEREQKYIDALDAYYKLDAKKKKQRGEAYIKALESISLEYPDDIEAKAMLGLQIWLNRGNEIPISSHLAVDALLKQVLAVEPLHPCHHYLIHLWDHEKPKTALEAAAKCGPAAPAIAHMWHMPGHIYSDLHRYADAAWQQEASARVDHAYMMRDRLMPDQIGNFAHNNEWLIRNLNFVGRTNDALDLAKNMIELPRHPDYNTLKKGSSSYGRRRLFETLSNYELWPELIALSQTRYLEPTDIEAEQIKRWQHLGMAYFLNGQSPEGERCLADLEAFIKQQKQGQAQAVQTTMEKARLDTADGNPPEPVTQSAAKPAEQAKLAIGQPPEPEGTLPGESFLSLTKEQQKKFTDAKSAAERPWKTKITAAEKATKQLQGFAQYAAGEYKTAYDLLKKAGGVDAGFLARVQLEVGEGDKAIEALQAQVKKSPGQILPQAELISALWKLDKKEEATKALEALRTLAGHADLHTPPMQRITSIAQALNLPADWRLPGKPAKDLGERPPLDSLGPYRWQPSPASNWTLKDVAGKDRSLTDYSGKPVIVIFYLGYGCLHCAEQLSALGPRTEDFSKAGIDLIAISTDGPEKLQQSYKDYQPGVFPFPLVSAGESKVFQNYRAYDDFEDQPLHGTFLIDGQGQVRWQDIGHEPFDDVDFLLSEAKRLLALPTITSQAAQTSASTK